MIIGNKIPQTIDYIDVILCLGQSNAGGRALSGRLANTLYNYRGISTGYPATRTSQTPYQSTNSNVYVYYKDYTSTTYNTVFSDDATWQTFNAGVNSRVQGTGFIGNSLSLSYALQEYTSKPVAVLFPVWGGTNLVGGTYSTSAPGYHRNDIARLSVDYINRGLRDLKTLFPNKVPRLVAVSWFQGENDAGNSINTLTYKDNFLRFKVFMDSFLKDAFTYKPYMWYLHKLQFQGTAYTQINTAFSQVCTENPDECVYVVLDAYPRRNQLTTAECNPIAFVAGSGNDDEHSSYIGQLSSGEIIANHIISRGIL